MAVIQERKSQDGKTKFRALIRLKGHPPVSATFNRKSDAKRWAARTEEEIKDGRYFKSAESQKHTVNDVIERYVEYVLPTKVKNVANINIHLKWWKDQIGHLYLSDITTAKIIECRERLQRSKTKAGKPKAPATVNRYMATLSHIFNVAIREWEWMEANPFSRIKKMKEPRGRVRFLEIEEKDRLLAACKESTSQHLYSVVFIALATGMRQGEILGLKWKDIDFDRRRITIHDTKNNERRSVPMAQKAYELLKDKSKVRHIGNPYVFPGDGTKAINDFRDSWSTALKRAQIENFRFHDLRHTAASYLAMNGATPTELAEILGHKTLEMVKRYAHLSETHTTKLVEDMASKFLE